MSTSDRAWYTTMENRRLRNGKGKEFAIRDLQKTIFEWLLYYVDERGRTWRELGEPWKDYTPGWKDAKQMLDDRNITYVEGDLREAIKRAMIELRSGIVSLDMLPVVAKATGRV